MQPYTLMVSGYDTNIIKNERDVKQLFEKNIYYQPDEQRANQAPDQINNRGQDVQRQNLGLADFDYCFICGNKNHWARQCPNRLLSREEQSQPEISSNSRIKKSNDKKRKQQRRQRRQRCRNDSSDDERKKVRRNDRSSSSSRHHSPIRIYININFKK